MRPPAGVKPLAAPVGLEDADAEPLTLWKLVWTAFVVMLDDAAAAADVTFPVAFWVA